MTQSRPPAKPGGTPDARDPARDTTPQRDDAGSHVPASSQGERYDDMKMPHERDESAAGDGHRATQDPQDRQDARGPRAVIRQGARDVEAGREDTDCYNAEDPRYRKREGEAP